MGIAPRRFLSILFISNLISKLDNNTERRNISSVRLEKELQAVKGTETFTVLAQSFENLF